MSEKLRIVRDIYIHGLTLLEMHAEQVATCVVPKNVAERYGFGDSLVIIRPGFGSEDECDPSDDTMYVPGVIIRLYSLRDANLHQAAQDELAESILKNPARPPEAVGLIREIDIEPEENGRTACSIASYVRSPQTYRTPGLESIAESIHAFVDSLRLQRKLGMHSVDLDERQRLLAMVAECLAIARTHNSEDEYEHTYGVRAPQFDLRMLYAHSRNLLRRTSKLVIPAGAEKSGWAGYLVGSTYKGPGPHRKAEIPYEDLLANDTAREAVKELRIAGPLSLYERYTHATDPQSPIKLSFIKLQFPVPAEDGLETREFTLVTTPLDVIITRVDGHVPTDFSERPVSPADGHPISAAECQALTRILEALVHPKPRWRRALGRIGLHHWTGR